MTPPYSHLTGGLMEDKNQTNEGKYESHFSGRTSSAGIRMNKDEKLAREAGIWLNIKVDI